MDGGMNVDSCNFTVMVNDVQDPEITNCPMNITTTNDPGVCGATVSWTEPTASDNCPGVTLSRSAGPAPGSVFSLGSTTVTYVATDASGRTANCSFTVTVSDNEAPVVSCNTVTAYLDASGIVTVDSASLLESLSENCGEATVLFGNRTFDCDSLGMREIVITASDTNGNSSGCTSMVTVLDTVSPMAIAMDITLTLNSDGIAVLSPHMIDNGSSDNCEIDTIFVSQDTFTCADSPDKMVTLTVQDGSGNMSTASAAVTIDGVVNADVVFIDVNATGLMTGLSWENAFTSFDQINNSCLDGVDTILVAQGLYRPNTLDRSNSFLFTGDIVVIGGYFNEGAGRDTTGTTTILNGDIGVEDQFGDNLYHTVFVDSMATGVVLDGFTIEYGNANGFSNADQLGGGLLCMGKADMKHMVFRRNLSTDEGAAVHVTSVNGDLSLKQSRVTGFNFSGVNVILSNDLGSELLLDENTRVLD